MYYRFIQSLLLMVAGACSTAVGIMLLVFMNSLPTNLSGLELFIMAILFIIAGIAAFISFCKEWYKMFH